MATRVKTVEYVFDTRLTNLATNTALGTATRHDFSAITLDIPENSSRVFKSVHIVASWNDANAVTYNVSGVRLGIKLGSTGFTDTDISPTAIANSGDHEYWEQWLDVTAYFVANFGSGTSQTAQVGIAVATATASNIGGHIAAKLVITYSFSDVSQTTRVKTVRIPLQSHHTTLTNAAQEFGTTGGTTNAPSNQIPALDSFLPENTVSIKQVWIEFLANNASAATTGIAPVYQIDAQTVVTRGTITQALNTGNLFRDVWLLDTTTPANPNYIATNAAHAIKAYCATTARFECFGGILHVTYTYNADATDTVLNSLVMPMPDDDVESNWVQATDGSTQNTLWFGPWIEEPGTITIKQSGVQLRVMSPGGGTLDLFGGGQTARPYTLTALVNAGGSVVTHRVDHSSGWTLARGKNSLLFNMFTTAAANTTVYGGMLYLNYTSGKSTVDVDAHNHSTSWYLADMQTSGAVETVRTIATANQCTPDIPETNYFLVSVGYELAFKTSASNVVTVLAEMLSGEHQADGWMDVLKRYAITDAELSTTILQGRALSMWNRNSFVSGDMNIESPRLYRVCAATGTHCMMRMWITHHGITFNKTGTVSGYGGTGVGISVELYDTTDNVKLCAVSTTSGGAYSVNWFDDTRTYYVAVREDDNHVGRSANWTF